jgi:SulP family sulfate permease
MLPAFTITMLGAIESLLSAMVADGMIASRHDSNQELIGQGIANIVSPWFGGIVATGAIARTATNVRSGGHTPVAGMVHALALLLIVLAAAPFARFIPLATFSGVLIVVAWRMGEWHNFAVMAHGPRGDFWVLLVTFALTVAFGLTVAVGIGLLIAAALFVRQMEAVTHIQVVTPESEIERGGESVREKDVPRGVVVYRFEGPLFFGVAEKLEAALERSTAMPRVVIFRMRNVPAIDGTALRALNLVRERFMHRGTRIVFSGLPTATDEGVVRRRVRRCDRAGQHLRKHRCGTGTVAPDSGTAAEGDQGLIISALNCLTNLPLGAVAGSPRNESRTPPPRLLAVARRDQ